MEIDHMLKFMAQYNLMDPIIIKTVDDRKKVFKRQYDIILTTTYAFLSCHKL